MQPSKVLARERIAGLTEPRSLFNGSLSVSGQLVQGKRAPANLVTSVSRRWPPFRSGIAMVFREEEPDGKGTTSAHSALRRLNRRRRKSGHDDQDSERRHRSIIIRKMVALLPRHKCDANYDLCWGFRMSAYVIVECVIARR